MQQAQHRSLGSDQHQYPLCDPYIHKHLEEKDSAFLCVKKDEKEKSKRLAVNLNSLRMNVSLITFDSERVSILMWKSRSVNIEIQRCRNLFTFHHHSLFTENHLGEVNIVITLNDEKTLTSLHLLFCLTFAATLYTKTQCLEHV